MDETSTLFIAGNATALGQTLRSTLRAAGYVNLVGEGDDEPDLTSAEQVERFFAEARPEYVFLVAGQTGGIHANQTRPAELMLDNLLTATNVVRAAHQYGVTKLLYLSSACTYPKHAEQPMRPDALMTAELEPTSAAYATAKLAGWQLCQAYRQQYGSAFITAIPANPFGPCDDFSPENGHVITALIRRMHEAKLHNDPWLTLWGTGHPRREFLYLPDLADACLFLIRHYNGDEPINVGSQIEVSIAEVARQVAEVVGYRGELVFDTTRPDGAPRKSLDARRLFALGWQPQTPLTQALQETYAWFLAHAFTEEPLDVRTTV